MARRESVLFVLGLVAFVSLGLPDAVLGVAWPSIRRDLGLPLDALGVLLFAATAGYLSASVLTGPLLRRLGVGELIVGSSALVVASALGYALSRSVGFLALAALLAGLGGGAIDAGINAHAAARFPAGHVAWLHASYGVGAACGPLLMTGVLGAGVSWRWGYMVLALILAALGCGFFRTRGLWDDHDPPAASTASHVRLGASLRRPAVWANVSLFLFYTGVEAMAGQWAFSLFTEGRGMPPVMAGMAVSGYWVSLTLGRVASGAIARIPPALLLRGSLAVAPVWTLILASALGAIPDLVSLALLGFTLGPVFPMLIAGTPTRVGEEHSANAVGLQIAGAALGAAALPAFAGVVGARHGLESIAVFLAGAALFVFALHEGVRAGERLA
jgi:fucose permease